MKLYHGTNAEHAHKFVLEGIDGTAMHPRAIHGAQDHEPGLFVTPVFSVARRFGLYVLEIDVEPSALSVPPMLRLAGANIDQSLNNRPEPQALLNSRVWPDKVRVVECHPAGYPFNPYDDSIPLVPGTLLPWSSAAKLPHRAPRDL